MTDMLTNTPRPRFHQKHVLKLHYLELLYLLSLSSGLDGHHIRLSRTGRLF